MSQTQSLDPNDLRDFVRRKYGEIALAASHSGRCSCGCSSESMGAYSEAEREMVPESAPAASLGCGNPNAYIALEEGEVVLDLGSGGGLDVLLTARRVGPSGRVYGLDMTDEMLALAESNRLKAGLTNVTFLKGFIEDIPLPSNHVDTIISNCVLNLSVDKPKVLQEAFRVLKPGGRIAIADIIAVGQLDDATLCDLEAYVGCVAGALDRRTYLELLANAGFVEIEIKTLSPSGCGSAQSISALILAKKTSQ